MNIIAVIGIVVTLLTAIPVIVQLRQHPRGLFILFFAEMWERFSFYGMRGLLIFYLTQHFMFDDTFANGLYGTYGSLVYLLPLIGGFLADHYLGTRKAVAFGALLLVAGHATMALEGPPATQVLTYQGQEYSFVVEGRGNTRHAQILIDGKPFEFEVKNGGLAIKDLPPGAALPAQLGQGSFELSVKDRSPIFTGIFFLALSLIVMGVGFLKPNISSLVGQLYPQADPRRDSGFTLFYYGINLGSFWAAILCGWLGQSIGWWAGFGAASIGMAAGYVVFVMGKPLLEGKGEPPEPAKLKRTVAGIFKLEWLIYAAALGGVGLVWLLVQRFELVGYALGVGSVAVLGYLSYFMATKCTRAESGRMLLALSLILFSVIFFTLFNQAGSSLNQFAQRNVDLTLLGFPIVASQTQSFNAGFILLLAPAFAGMWAYLEPRHLDPNAPAKFGLALLQIAAGFAVLVWGATNFVGPNFQVPLVFLIVMYLFHTTGELCLSPVGLSQMTRLSPPATVATVMATWFLGSAWAGYAGALIARLTAAKTLAGQVLDPAAALATYISVFTNVALWGAGLGLVVLALSPLLGRLERRGETAVPQPAAGE